MGKGIFIAATGQHVGKTTTCLGIISGLKKRFNKVGFIKPIGQQHLNVDGTLVDKDVVLFKEHFDLNTPYTDMSPVLIPAGFTRDFLDKKITEIDLKNKIIGSYSHINAENDYIIAEGTGHIGVGSIINLNNASVAKMLGLDMIIVASGGLGSCIDEIVLNRQLCLAYGVRIRGIILNKVLAEKREMILEYIPKALKPYDIPLLGCIPYNDFLTLPSCLDFENLFETTLLTGEESRYRHFQHTRLVDTSLKLFREDKNSENLLIITPATREDVVLATLAKYWSEKTDIPSHIPELGIILTGKTPPRTGLVEKIKRTNIPCLYTPLSSYRAMQKITSFTAKIQQEDKPKVQRAIDLVEPHINFSIFT